MSAATNIFRISVVRVYIEKFKKGQSIEATILIYNFGDLKQCTVMTKAIGRGFGAAGIWYLKLFGNYKTKFENFCE